MKIPELTEEDKVNAKQFREEKLRSDPANPFTKASEEMHPEDKTEDILEFSDLLKEVTEEIQKKVVGEKNKIKTIFLVSCGRLVKNHQDKTNSNLMICANSGAGKDFVCRNTLKIWNEESLEHYTRISPTALDHYEFNWNDKILYLEDMDNAILNSNTFKTFTSSGSSTLITAQNKNIANKKIIIGKPIVILTTAAATPNKELLRRFPILYITESSSHTKKIMKRQREIAETGEKTVHNMPLRVALSALGPVEVVIPFAGMLEGILPDNHIIMNTHHQRFLGYIQNSAALYQKQRKENDKGQIEADFEDYENAKLILKETTTNVLMIPLTKTQKAIIDSAKKMEWFSVREMEIEAHTTNKTIRLQLESHLNDFFETKIEDPDNDRGIFKPTKKYKLKQELIQESLELPSSEDVREGKIGFAKEGIDTNITKSIGIGCKEIIEEVVEVC